jgi:hypothetical protein
MENGEWKMSENEQSEFSSPGCLKSGHGEKYKIENGELIHSRMGKEK